MAALGRVGLVTSLGTHAPSVCAALRAGMARPRQLEGVVAWDGEQPGEVPAIGHPASLDMTAGYQVPARWLRMLRVAWEGAGGGEDPAPRLGSSVWLCLPSPDEVRFADGLHDAQWFAERLRSLPGAAASHSTVSLRGVAGFWSSLADACLAMEQGRTSRAYVLVADSLLDAESLAWLAACRRLKTPEHPTGLAPGEAAACLVLEPQGDVALAGAAHAAVASEEARLGGAKALAQVLGAAIGSTAWTIGAAIGNQNGEEARAFAWGCAQTSLLAKGTRLGRDGPLIATSLGDVGMCAPAIGIALAAAAYRRRWAAPGATAVWSVVDATAGACLVAAKEVAR